MMVYEERKQKAIEMMQGARRQDEDAEYLQAVKNSKIHLINNLLEKLTER